MELTSCNHKKGLLTPGLSQLFFIYYCLLCMIICVHFNIMWIYHIMIYVHVGPDKQYNKKLILIVYH